MQLCADQLEEEALGGCQGAWMRLRAVADVGEGDGAVGCWGGGTGGEALRLEVELEVGEVGHCDARGGGGGDAPAVGFFESGDFGWGKLALIL